MSAASDFNKISDIKCKELGLSKLPLSCKISAEFGSNSNAFVKSSIAWYQEEIKYCVYMDQFFLQLQIPRILSYSTYK